MLIITSILIGFGAGFLSGEFGIGGGLITKPAIRLILGKEALIAVGTPLPIIIPTVLIGLYNYYKNQLVDYRAAVIIGVCGAITSIFGAALTLVVGGSALLIIAAVLIGLISLRYLFPSKKTKIIKHKVPETTYYLALTGLIAGFFAGFLGLGGGFIVVPALFFIFGKDTKEAIGTSLLSIAFFAIPGSLAHIYIGNVDLVIALYVIIGVLPGAYLGSRLTVALDGRITNILFGVLLLVASGYLAVNEVLFLLR